MFFCLSVCVCERERERDKETDRERECEGRLDKIANDRQKKFFGSL